MLTLRPRRLPILAATDNWVVVAKPSGLSVHPSAMVRERVTAMSVVRDQLGRRVNPVHRLDRATSGCLLFAFEREWTTKLQAAMTAGTKRYLAFVRGHTASREPVVIDNPMKDDRGIERTAETWAQPVASCREPRSSLVLAQPRTGRYHQVRRHLRDLSHPVLGDSTHGDTRANRWWRENYALPRLGLHCLSLDLDVEGTPIHVTCPVPEEMLGLWRRLPWWDEAVAAVPELSLPEAA
ncbi:MAG: tRNA pseudouridine65 synthase [Myxococcota bacterium]